ncbi:alpha-amylase [Mucilaginibacter hurinus]|uniref:Alpha-amylase n=1 Tax=Mucilaginibacter hurinus TaxID=2201324 RepID=A0A367GNK5_9SPHI|nr:alpha-amylase family glycosyl hydrolase [Mucilaginibacter hurinus]RCH55057.1 alpha-amylase [Mucilaginibacter hurinus]
MKNVYKIVVLFILLAGTACKKNDVKKPPVTPPPEDTTTTNPEIPNNAKDGVTFVDNGTAAIFNLYAPGKVSVSVIGDFNNWSTTATPMTRTTDGTRWWVKITGLDPNTEYAYQYYINGSLRVADPYTEKILDPDNDRYIPATVYPGLKAYPTGKTSAIVSVMQANQPGYTWKVNNFTRPAKKDLVVYELLIRDFIADHSYKTLIDTLDYISRLGVNAIELMPVSEFEGNESWGYNNSFFFAPDKYYGTKNDLKAFIDACHQRGIAVIMDIVLNHAFGSSPMARMYWDNSANKPSSTNPWFNVDAKHPANVGSDFNHESAATKYFAKNVMTHWLKEYKIDGYRFDLSKGFTQKYSSPEDYNSWGQYDAGRVAIWKDYYAHLKSIDPNAYVILEHFGGMQEEKELADLGMTFWANISHNFQEANMGWLNDSNLQWMLYPSHTFTRSDNMISYAESHDEERIQFKTKTYGNQDGYNVRVLANALKRGAMDAAFLMSAPGPKMIWQFGELGYDISIDQNGRTGNKPILWNYQGVPERRALYNAYAKYIKMKLKNPVFSTTDFTGNLGGAVKTLTLKSPDVDVIVVGNYDVKPQSATVTFTKTGSWRDYVDGSNRNITTTLTNITLQPGEYHIYSSAPLQ